MQNYFLLVKKFPYCRWTNGCSSSEEAGLDSENLHMIVVVTPCINAEQLNAKIEHPRSGDGEE
jgi:hypothetical protein